jgi:NTE family protein
MTNPTGTERKRLKIALQGGGSHGAFTWGVLDRLLADDRLDIEAVVGTSAGAMNAVVLVEGLRRGGPAAARKLLRQYWEGVSSLASLSPLQPTFIDRLLGPGNMDYSPSWRVADVLSKIFSPYEMNPGDLNPLRDLLARLIDFAKLREEPGTPLYVCATNVLTGRLRVFARNEMSVNAIMASACLPMMFHAQEVDGEFYWDGGYCGNPPIFPLIYMGGGQDVLIVQLNPINIPVVPQDTRSILDRINTLSFNSSLMREMRMIQFVTDLIDKGELNGERFLRMYIHTIDAETEIAALSPSSKFNADQDFLRHLHALGAAKAEAFLAAHFDDIGQRSSTNITEKFV